MKLCKDCGGAVDKKGSLCNSCCCKRSYARRKTEFLDKFSRLSYELEDGLDCSLAQKFITTR